MILDLSRKDYDLLVEAVHDAYLFAQQRGADDDAEAYLDLRDVVGEGPHQ